MIQKKGGKQDRGGKHICTWKRENTRKRQRPQHRERKHTTERRSKTAHKRKENVGQNMQDRGVMPEKTGAHMQGSVPERKREGLTLRDRWKP